MAASAAWVLATERLLERYDPLCVTAFTMLVGLLALLPIALWMDGVPAVDLSGGTWLGLAALGIGCTAATYGLWNWGLQHVPAARAGVYVNLEPLLGAVLGVALLQDAAPPGLLAGGVLILLSALLITWSDTVERDAATPRPGDAETLAA
jgi:drug/metabolite transporter (DMT)-like permease